jgi:folate-binding Fe-S cluster repair protein YgfZ
MSSKAFADASGGVAKHFLCVVTVKTVYLTTNPTKMGKKTQFLENMALNLKFTLTS